MCIKNKGVVFKSRLAGGMRLRSELRRLRALGCEVVVATRAAQVAAHNLQELLLSTCFGDNSQPGGDGAAQGA